MGVCPYYQCEAVIGDRVRYVPVNEEGTQYRTVVAMDPELLRRHLIEAHSLEAKP